MVASSENSPKLQTPQHGARVAAEASAQKPRSLIARGTCAAGHERAVPARRAARLHARVHVHSVSVSASVRLRWRLAITRLTMPVGVRQTSAAPRPQPIGGAGVR